MDYWGPLGLIGLGRLPLGMIVFKRHDNVKQAVSSMFNVLCFFLFSGTVAISAPLPRAVGQIHV